MYRNPKLLKVCRLLSCQLCDKDDGTIVAAHSNQLFDGKGKGIKASDYRIAALCFTCHYEIDQGTKYDKQERRELWEQAHRKTIGELFEKGYIKC
jgi:predicted GNAT superfamily acetyltransferase